jgi:hypothetical protein
MIEAEAIVNSRPRTVITNTSSPFREPLTANHLLTLKSKVILPLPGMFQDADVYSLRRWRRVQYLSNQFWNRWKRKFLQSLQERQKWSKRRRNLEVGDVVIVKDQQLPRNQWCLARVKEVSLDDDDLVRKVKIQIADRNLDSHGRRCKPFTVMERPVQKLILLLAKNEQENGYEIPQRGAVEE